MQGLSKCLLQLSKAVVMALLLSPLVNADPTPPPESAVDYSVDSESKFTSAGTSAGQIEAVINNSIINKTVQDFGYSIYQQGRDFGTGGDESVSSSPTMDFVSKHKNAYCSGSIASEVAGFGCPPKVPAVIGLPALPGMDDGKYLELGDINFSVVLDPNKYSYMTDLTAQNLIRNIVSPFPDPKYKNYVNKPGFLDNGTQKEEYAKFMAGQALLGVALHSLNEMYAMRLPAGIPVPESMKSKMSFELPPSMMDIMQTESSRRFEKPEFVNYLDGLVAGTEVTPEAKMLKEIAMMEAFRLWMDYQRFKQSERMESLLAASLSKYINSSYASDAMMAKMNR